MEKEINKTELEKFRKSSYIFSILLIGSVIAFYPLVHFFNLFGWVIWGTLFAVTLFFSIIIEKQKKRHNIQTYKEIKAFFDGVMLDEIEEKLRTGKKLSKWLQNVLMMLAAAAVTAVVIILFGLLFRFLGV